MSSTLAVSQLAFICLGIFAYSGARFPFLTAPVDEAVALREALIRRTAEVFRPDLLVVDKEPTGFRGEVLPTLRLLREEGCRLVLGVRDVLDDGAAPAARNQALIDAPRSIAIIQGDLSAAANSQPTGAAPMGTDNEAGPEIAPITAAVPTSTPDDP